MNLASLPSQITATFFAKLDFSGLESIFCQILGICIKILCLLMYNIKVAGGGAHDWAKTKLWY